MKKRLFGLATAILLSVSSFNLLASDLVVVQNSDAKSLDPQVSNDVPTHRVTLTFTIDLLKKIKI